MLDPTDLRKIVDITKRELEKAMLYPSDSTVRCFRQQLAQDIAKALPACFPETIHAVIARSVEPALSEVVSRLVVEGVERAIRPLAEEVARLRRSIEQDSEHDTWWKRGSDADQQPDPPNGEGG
jgi:hypothetical protein